jgi:flagellar protein FliL
MMKIIMLANLVFILLAAGVVFYSHTMIKPPRTDQALEREKLQKDAIQGAQLQPVPIKRFVVNLHSRPTRLRYLDLEMNVLTFSENQKEIIRQNEHIFKDSVVEIASHLSPEDLDTVTGKILLENKIKTRVNQKFGQPVVRQIYFSGFVVQ